METQSLINLLGGAALLVAGWFLREMWDAVKNIKTPNPIPDRLEGFTVALNDLLVADALENLNGTGLVVYGKNGAQLEWIVEDANDTDDDTGAKNIHYRVLAGRDNFSVSHEVADAKKKFVDSFIKWLAKYITPQMLIDMDIDLEAPSVVKRSRKILQLAET